LSPHESSIIQALTNEVRDMRQELAVIRTKLFGDQDTETDQGRIPRIEAEQRHIVRRLKRIEPLALALRAVYALGLALAGYLLNHFLPLKGH
jgi:hypothetical protein